MSEQLRSLASLWRGGSDREASYADDIFDLLEQRDALRAQVAALEAERAALQDEFADDFFEKDEYHRVFDLVGAWADLRRRVDTLEAERERLREGMRTQIDIYEKTTGSASKTWFLAAAKMVEIAEDALATTPAAPDAADGADTHEP